MTISIQVGSVAPDFPIEDTAAEEAAAEGAEEEEEYHLWPQEEEIQTTETMARS